MLSVLVTCYNQKDIITKTLDSLINQVTDFDYNIIVSDDLSTDGSYQLLCEYANLHPIVTVIQPKTKKRVGHNRNNLINFASAKYSCFVDGDDLQAPHFIDDICKNLGDDDIYKIKSFSEVWSDENIVVKDALNYENIFLNIYKTSILKTMKFNPDLKIGEDVIFSLKYNKILQNYSRVIDVNYLLNRRDENISLTKNGSHLERFELENKLLTEFLKYEEENDYTKVKVNQKKVDVINYAFIANQPLPKYKVDLKYLPKKHLISYLMYKIMPKLIYKKIIFRQIAHKL